MDIQIRKEMIRLQSQKWIFPLRLCCATLVMTAICCTVTAWIHPTLASSLRCLYVCLPIWFCAQITRHSGRLLLFLAASAGMTALTFLLAAPGAEQIVFTGCTLVICGTFLFARARQTDCILLQPHGAVLLLFFGMYLIGKAQQFPILCLLAHYFTIVFLLLLFVYSNLSRFQDFMVKNSQSANVPFHRIRRINRLLLTVTTAIAALVLFAMPVSGSAGIASLLKQLLVFVLRPVFALLNHMGGEEAPPLET